MTILSLTSLGIFLCVCAGVILVVGLQKGKLLLVAGIHTKVANKKLQKTDYWVAVAEWLFVFFFGLWLIIK